MRWKAGRRSQNVQDRRGTRTRSSGIRLPGKRGGLLTIVIMLGAMYFGVDPAIISALLGGGTGQQQAQPRQPTAAENQLADFVSVVLADTEDTWDKLFRAEGSTYQTPTLVLFTDVVKSACGTGQAAMGPFYCPLDKQVFIDLSFYQSLKDRHNAPGDFAQAYVVAHEVGHHVQNLLGISTKVHNARSSMGKAEGNALSVLQELQADCFAGLWAHHANKSRDILEQGDIEEAMRAATAIGDDTLQRQAQGRVVPESFTHGTSAQRVQWFRTGLERGTLKACDTFSQ